MNNLKIILGTVQFGLDYGINNISGKPTIKEVTRILEFAHENNVHILDTAEAYGNAQQVIGEYHNFSNHKFDITTKFNADQNTSEGNLILKVEKNLKTLGVESLYGYMFHSYHDFKRYFTIYEKELEILKKQGKIRKFGVSVYLNSELEDVINCDAINLIQLPFNMLDNIVQRGALIEKAKARGIEIHTRSAFLQGLFFLDNDKIPVKLKILHPYIEKLKTISKKSGRSITDLALNYVVQQDKIDYAVIGVDTYRQLKENIDSLENKLTRDILEEISSIVVKETNLLNPSIWNA